MRVLAAGATGAAAAVVGRKGQGEGQRQRVHRQALRLSLAGYKDTVEVDDYLVKSSQMMDGAGKQ